MRFSTISCSFPLPDVNDNLGITLIEITHSHMRRPLEELAEMSTVHTTWPQYEVSECHIAGLSSTDAGLMISIRILFSGEPRIKMHKLVSRARGLSVGSTGYMILPMQQREPSQRLEHAMCRYLTRGNPSQHIVVPWHSKRDQARA